MSEYSKLLDLAIESGANQSDIVEKIRSKVLDNYYTLYPDSQRNAEVVINAITGDIKVVADGKEVAPKEFVHLAEKTAREIIIDNISKNAPQTDKSPQTKNDNDKFTSFMAGFIFWGYNLLYIALTSAILVQALFSKRSEFINLITETNPFKVILVLGLLLVPYFVVYLSLHLRKQNIKYKYGGIFFLLEIPVVLAGTTFLTLFPEPSKIMIFLFVIIMSSVPMFFANITGYEYKFKTPLFMALFIKLSLFITLSYLCLILSFFIAPLFAEAFYDILFSRSFDFADMFVRVLEFIIIFIPVLLVLSIPFLVTIKSFKIFYLQWIKSSRDKGENYLVTRSIGITAIWIILVAILSYQPSPDNYFNKLLDIHKLSTYEERESLTLELSSKKNLLENAINDMANFKDRYIMAKNDDTISRLYIDSFDLDSDTATKIEDVFEIIAYPFVYQGSFENKYTIINTYNYVFGDDKETTLAIQNVDLIKRNIDTVTSYDGLLATITIEDEFKNTTSRNEEVSYHFSLPPGSVITNLQLGPDLEFKGLVAPQGAATRTFNAQIQTQRDPALLEQIGPNSYRLRVFPIPGKNDTVTLKGKNQRVAFTYVTAVEKNGFALPSYKENINIKDTGVIYSLKVNGIYSNLSQDNVTKGGYIPSPEKCNYTLNSQTDHLTKITNYGFQNPCNLIANAKDLKIAIFFNTTIANKQYKYEEKLSRFFKDNEGFLSANSVEFFKYNDVISKPQTLTKLNSDQILDNITYFGSTSIVDLSASIKRSYDLIFVFDNISKMTKSLYDNVSLINDTGFLQVSDNLLPTLLKSNTYSYTSFEQALVYALAHNSSFDSIVAPNIHGEFSKVYVDLPILIETQASDPLSYVFAKAIIDEKIRDRSTLIQDTAFLDELDLIATNANIVTPYSSLIALVNDQQISQLERESMRADRYREQTTTQPQRVTLSDPADGISSDLNLNFFGMNKSATDTQMMPPVGYDNVSALDYSSGIFSIIGPITAFGLFIVVIGGIVFIVRKRLPRK
ncbi:hypothetical protein IPM62_02610 [Candidatus Woesebacteria bacterium]|nr:MAG: hypothetical protein IPM62_02610 [Candidatus Woesebacteria bacterium]